MSDAPQTSALPLTLLTSVAPPSASESPDVDTAALTCRLTAGDEQAFREFHARYFDVLYRFLLVVTRGDAHLAQEALQETLLRVTRYIRPFGCEAAFVDWLKVIARNTARDGGRKRSRYRALLERFTRERPPEIASPDASEAWREVLDDSLAELSTADRELVCGKYLRGDSVAQLSVATGLTEKAVESRLLRIRRALAARVVTKLNPP